MSYNEFYSLKGNDLVKEAEMIEDVDHPSYLGFCKMAIQQPRTRRGRSYTQYSVNDLYQRTEQKICGNDLNWSEMYKPDQRKYRGF